MANTFYRFPIPGGDLNVGAQYNEQQLNGVIGVLSGRLYNSGGVLNVPLCRIGIDNGTYKGIADIDTITAVSLAGCSNSNWLAIEMSVAGSAVSFSATDIAGATDPTIIPASVRAAWDGRKLGYYLTATKRLVALVWLNSTGVLLAVVNFEGKNIFASQIGLHTATIHEQYGPGKGIHLSAAWNLDTTPSIAITHGLGVFHEGISGVMAKLKIVSGGGVWAPIPAVGDNADPNLIFTGISNNYTTDITLRRRTGSSYDAAGYNDCVAHIIITFIEY